MLELLGQAALRTLLLAAIVQIGLGLFQVKRPQLRFTMWTVVLAASLAMPVLQWASPVRLPILPDPSRAALTADLGLQPQTSAPQVAMTKPAALVTTPNTAKLWLEALYLLVTGILLIRLAIGLALSLRLVSKATPVQTAWAMKTRIRISGHVVTPVTVANVVLLPLDALTWPLAMRDAVLAHERAHIARGDFATLVASQVNQAVFWFSPLSWWLHRRLGMLAELACDDQAMKAIGDRPGYAEVLLEMGRRSGPLCRELAMARPATLTSRIERILSADWVMPRVDPVQQITLIIGTAGLSIIAASSCFTSASPLALISSAPRTYSPTIAGLTPPPSAAEHDEPEPAPIRGRLTDNAPQLPLTQPAPAVSLARPLRIPALRGTAQPTARQPTRNTLLPLPSHPAVQRASAERDPAWRDVWPTTGIVASTNPAPRANDRPGTTYGMVVASPDGQAPSSHRVSQQGINEPLLRSNDKPSCTGIHVAKPDGPYKYGPVSLIQSQYFQELDGTPWLRLVLGARTQVMLNGFAVERTSISTTIVTPFPRGTKRVTGTTHGVFGTVDFECIRPEI